MELMVKMMALQRMENKVGGQTPQAGGAAAAAAGGADGSEEGNTSAGCTANVALVLQNEVIVANAGDSRAVICNKGKAKPLSFDHKPNLPEEMARIKKAGGWVTDGSTGHYRVNGNLNLSRSIGDLKYKTNTALPPEKQVVTAQPDVVRHQRAPDDEFLVMACDGIWDCMSNQEVCDFVRQRLKKGTKISGICEEIFSKCIAEVSILLQSPKSYGSIVSTTMVPIWIPSPQPVPLQDPKATSGIGGDNMTCIIVLLNDR